MRDVTRVARCFEHVHRDVHEARWRLVWSLVESLCLGAKATVTSIGRGLRRRVGEKHAIKCADRALSNKHLQDEVFRWYRGIAHRVIKPGSRPVIAIDATDFQDGWAAMRASVAFDGRAITILNDVRQKKVMTRRTVLSAFLQMLKKVLPTECRPVVVVDGGFRGPFFEEVRKLGWDFVGRPQSNVYLYGASFTGQVRKIYKKATSRPKDLGWLQYTRKRYVGRIVLHDGRAPKARRFRRRGQERERKRRLKASEPWVLITSLEKHTAKQVVDVYKTRMQIEETFRDDKSSRFGRSLEQSRCRSRGRLEVMLLLLALASLVLLIVGFITEQRGHERSYRANTSKKRSLSLVALGLRVLRRQHTPLLYRDFVQGFVAVAACGAGP